MRRRERIEAVAAASVMSASVAALQGRGARRRRLTVAVAVHLVHWKVEIALKGMNTS